MRYKKLNLLSMSNLKKQQGNVWSQTHYSTMAHLSITKDLSTVCMYVQCEEVWEVLLYKTLVRCPP